MDYPKISVVIGSYNRRKLLELCIDAVREELHHEAYEIIVVDGGSTDGTVEWLTAQKDIISIIQHNRGKWRGKPLTRKPWAYFMNLAFKAASGKYICLLSDNSLIVPGAIMNGIDLFDEMLAQGVKLGGVAFYFRDYPVHKQYAIGELNGVPHVSQGLLFNPALQEVGYCNEDYLSDLAHADLMFRMQAAGYRFAAMRTSFVECWPKDREGEETALRQQDWRRLHEFWPDTMQSPDQPRPAEFPPRTGHVRPAPVNRETLNRLLMVMAPSSPVATVSVITVVFQDPAGLEKTIRSVLEQTYPQLEFIVIDGGSQDATQDVLYRYRDSIDTVVSEADDGIYDAMNKGIALAKGDYAIFMNADDVFASPDVVAQVAPYLDGQTDVVYGHRNYVRKSGSMVQQKSHEASYVRFRMPYCHQAAFCRTETLRCWPFNMTYRYSADYNQVAEIFRNGGTFRQVDLTICNYASGGMSESGLRPYLEVLKIQFDNFGDGPHMKSSEYMKGFIGQRDKLLAAYTAEGKPNTNDE